MTSPSDSQLASNQTKPPEIVSVNRIDGVVKQHFGLLEFQRDAIEGKSMKKVRGIVRCANPKYVPLPSTPVLEKLSQSSTSQNGQMLESDATLARGVLASSPSLCSDTTPIFGLGDGGVCTRCSSEPIGEHKCITSNDSRNDNQSDCLTHCKLPEAYFYSDESELEHDCDMDDCDCSLDLEDALVTVMANVKC